MLRIAVCDDEQNYLNDTKKLLDEYGVQQGIEVVVSTFLLPLRLADNIEAGNSFDIYLLDVYMPGMTGIELAQELRKLGVNAPIIFLTTSRDHALEAFGVGALGYLVKPFERNTFFKTIDFAGTQCESEQRRSVLLKVNNEVHSVAIRDIICSEAQKNYQQIHLTDGQTIKVRMTVSELFSRLDPSGNFIRCGTAYILNLAKLRCLNTKTASMANGMEIPVPRGTYAEIKTAYYNFYSER